MTTETYDRETLKAIMAEARRQGFDNTTIADKLNLSLADVVRIEGENTMASLISMADFISAKKLTEDLAVIADAFIDENGWTLKERERRTRFLERDLTLSLPTDPQNAEIWQRREAALVQETAQLVDAMKGASFSAWCAAMRIVGVRLGVKLPLRPGDHDPDEPGEL